MTDHRYPVSWTMKLEDPPLSGEEVEAREVGACDTFFFASTVYAADGSSRTILGSLDGRTGETLNDHEFFQVLSLLALRLSRSTTLDEGRRKFCEHAFETIRKATLGARPKEKEHPS